MRRLTAILVCLPFMLTAPTAQFALGADTSIQISVPDEVGGRVDSRMDLIEFRAIEPTPWETDNWEFELMLSSSCGFLATDDGNCIYGIDLDYDGDAAADMVLTSNFVFDPLKGGSENALLIDVSTQQILCEGQVSESVYVLKDHWWGGTLVPFITLSISKSCLTQSASVGLSAWATIKGTGVYDLVPDSGFQSFRQPWVNPVAHLAGQGPSDGEFSAWTKQMANGEQIKFYAKYMQPGQKVQFMVQNSKGSYEQYAWKRVETEDLNSDGSYKDMQNHIYFIRTLDLKPGKNRVRILVDGEIVWGTKTYVP